MYMYLYMYIYVYICIYIFIFLYTQEKYMFGLSYFYKKVEHYIDFICYTHTNRSPPISLM